MVGGRSRLGYDFIFLKPVKVDRKYFSPSPEFLNRAQKLFDTGYVSRY